MTADDPSDRQRPGMTKQQRLWYMRGRCLECGGPKTSLSKRIR